MAKTPKCEDWLYFIRFTSIGCFFSGGEVLTTFKQVCGIKKMFPILKHVPTYMINRIKLRFTMSQGINLQHTLHLVILEPNIVVIFLSLYIYTDHCILHAQNSERLCRMRPLNSSHLFSRTSVSKWRCLLVLTNSSTYTFCRRMLADISQDWIRSSDRILVQICNPPETYWNKWQLP